VGLKPYTPQYAEGSRIEPAKSFPNDKEVIPVANATAQPPLLPPLVLLISQALLVFPKIALSAYISIAKTDKLVLPIIIAPSDLSSFTSSASFVGIWFGNGSCPDLLVGPCVK
jgi:hypothetical protein